MASRNHVSFRFSVNKLKNKLHYHGCDRCHGRYTCSCGTPDTDLTCSRCRGGHGDSTTSAALRPRGCCGTESRQARPAERDMYRLAGPGPWWVCTHCWRQHPSNPTRRNP